MSKKTAFTANKKPVMLEYLAYRKQQGSTKDFTQQVAYLKDHPSFFKLMNLMPCTVAFLDYQTQRYLWVSEGLTVMCGYTPQEVMQDGRLWLSLVHPDDVKKITGPCFEKILNTLHSYSEEKIKQCKFSFNYRVKRKDGTWIMVLQNSAYIELDEDRNPLLVLSLVSDITSFKSDNRITLSVSHYDEQTGITQITSDGIDSDMVISSRENEIIQLIFQGMTSKKIADKLFVSEHTIKTHRKNIFDKTGCKNAPDLIRYAMANGII